MTRPPGHAEKLKRDCLSYSYSQQPALCLGCGYRGGKRQYARPDGFRRIVTREAGAGTTHRGISRPPHDGQRGSLRASDSGRDGRGWKMSAAGEGAVGPLWIVCGRGGGGVGRGHVSLR